MFGLAAKNVPPKRSTKQPEVVFPLLCVLQLNAIMALRLSPWPWL